MNGVDTVLRRNFIIASVLHVVVIGGVIVWELVIPATAKRSVAVVELVMPADIKGELPVGPGHGRGAYTPALPTPRTPSEPAGGSPGAPENPPLAGDETPAPLTPPTPPAKVVSQPRLAPNEIGIPSPKQAVTSPKTAPPTRTPAKTASTSTKVAPPKTKATTTPSKTVSVSSGQRAGTGRPSAEEIRQRFMSSMAATTGGTPYGDGSVAGGGSGRTNRIGSPDGSDNGVPGGVGPGSPHWEYYLHVHDKVYQAWEQPGSVRERGLVAVVLIKVARDGSITDARLTKTSGNRSMDNSVLEAVRRVRLLEPPPAPLVKGTTAEISIDFGMEG